MTQSAPVTVTLQNGQTVAALTPERVHAIINGMIGKGKVLTAADNGRYIKGITVQGGGNAFTGKIGLRYIYNVDLVSMVALEGPKATAAAAAIDEALENGDLLAIHNACREYMNAVTVSFNATSKQFSSRDLVKAQVNVVTTDNGNLITLEKVSAEAAEALAPRKDLAFVPKFKSTLLVSTPAEVLAPADAIS